MGWQQQCRTIEQKNKINVLILGHDALSVEIWFGILSFLRLEELFNLWMCSKGFYYIVHQYKKYKKRFDHSKRMVSGVDICETFPSNPDNFFKKVSSTFGFCNVPDDVMNSIKKRFKPVVIERILPFRIYSHLLSVTETWKVAVTFAVWSLLKTEKFLLPSETVNFWQWFILEQLHKTGVCSLDPHSDLSTPRLWP